MKKNKFKNVFDKEKTYFTKYLVAYITDEIELEDKKIDIGIIVSKKVGNSVIRHRYTRLIREVFRLNSELFPDGISVIVIAKRNILEKSYDQIEEDFLRLINIYKKHK